jgi:hypothetical protein
MDGGGRGANVFERLFYLRNYGMEQGHQGPYSPAPFSIFRFMANTIGSSSGVAEILVKSGTYGFYARGGSAP